MKIANALSIIENGWIRKPTGFRVKFHRQTETGFEVDYSPSQEEAPLNSDVTAWRFAWKLGQATQAEAETGGPGALYDIIVVDARDQPIRFYGTGELEAYNPRLIKQ